MLLLGAASATPPERASRADYVQSDRYPIHSPLESITSLLPSFASSSSTSSPSRNPIFVGSISAFASVGVTLGIVVGYRRYWRRIRNANDVTNRMLEGQRWIRGVVTSVGDGDNFRLFHTPGPFYNWPLKIRSMPSTHKELKDQTLHIRISGVDAPENAHFGNPQQPHAKESLDWLRGLLVGKRMKCQLLRKDQYNRIVAVPYIRRMLLPNKPLPVMMLKEGMASVYESGGAEYGPWGLEGLKKYEAEARANKMGVWAAKSIELPGDYKKRMKMAEEGRLGMVKDTVPSPPRRTLFSRVLGMFRGTTGSTRRSTI